MANNITAKDASGASKTLKTTDNTDVHTPHTNVDSMPSSVTGPLDDIKTATESLAGLISSGKLLVDDADTQVALASILSALASVAVTGPLTDTELRASAVPVSGPLTDAELRDSAVPVSVSGGATSAKQDDIIGGVGATSDSPSTGTNNGSVIALLKQLRALFNGSVTALANGVSNPSLGFVGAFKMLWNGTTWDRAPGTTNGAYSIVRDAAGNARGVNVDSSNRLQVIAGASDALLTTIDADTGNIALGVGGVSDAAATQGSTGSVSAKLRTVTSQLNTLNGLLTKPMDTDYETIAASQTDQMMGGTGAAGDHLAGVLIIPETTSPGEVSIEDGSTNMRIFTGGTDSVLSLVPFFVPLGINSVSGGWEITTGANVRAIAVGSFSA